jgi:hypothetical protein
MTDNKTKLVAVNPSVRDLLNHVLAVSFTSAPEVCKYLDTNFLYSVYVVMIPYLNSFHIFISYSRYLLLRKNYILPFRSTNLCSLSPQIAHLLTIFAFSSFSFTVSLILRFPMFSFFSCSVPYFCFTLLFF